MFGTIGHFKVKPGHEQAIKDLEDEWTRTIRLGVPGLIAEFTGYAVGRDNEAVHAILMQDEETYRKLADLPAQDAWYRKLVTHLVEEPTWEDVAWDSIRLDTQPTSEGFAGKGTTKQTTTTTA